MRNNNLGHTAIRAAALAWTLLSHPILAQNSADMLPTPEQMARGVDPQLLGQLRSYAAQLNSNPNDVTALVNRGVISLKISYKNMYSVFWLYLAARDLEKAIHLDPNNFYARHNYAEVCFHYGDAPNDHQAMNIAIREFSKAIAIRPNSARSYMGRSWAYLMLNDEAHFEADSQKALELDPSLQSEMNKMVAGIRENRRQGQAAQDILKRMARYYVDPWARTEDACRAAKGFWTQGQCRISTALDPTP